LKTRRDDVRKTLLASLKRERANSQVFGVSEFSRLVDVYTEHYLSQLRADKGCPLDSPDSDKAGGLFETVTGFMASDLATRLIASELGVPPIVVGAGINLINSLKTGDSPGSSTTRVPTQYNPSPDDMNAIEVMAQTRAFYHSK
jgi:hypothetical protein